jgi:hypothetical protein
MAYRLVTTNATRRVRSTDPNARPIRRVTLLTQRRRIATENGSVVSFVVSGSRGGGANPNPTVNSIQFSLTPTGDAAIGRLVWNNGDHTLEVPLTEGVTLQIGQEQLVFVRNMTGSTIPNGSVVAIDGAQGQRIKVILADANEIQSHATLGIATEDITHNGFGFVTTQGLVRGLNTSAFAEGAEIFLSETAGAFTDERPAAPNHSVFLGIVVNSAGGTAGSIFVRPAVGAAIGELHDVIITNPTTGQQLRLNAQGVWENFSPATSYPPNGAAGGVLSGSYPNPGFAVDMATQAEAEALASAAQAAAIAAAAADATAKANTAESTAKSYADTLVIGLVDDRGSFDASVNTFPTTGGSGTAGAILKGDLWTIGTAATGGPLNGYGLGCTLRALIDSPGQTTTNWAITAVGFGYVPENVANKSSDVATDQASNTKFPTTKAVYDWATGQFTTPGQASAAAPVQSVNGKTGTVATIVEVADFASLPETGASLTTYITIDTNKTYRWDGAAYAQIGGGSQIDIQDVWAQIHQF